VTLQNFPEVSSPFLYVANPPWFLLEVISSGSDQLCKHCRLL
jgi:hypothetical protein